MTTAIAPAVDPSATSTARPVWRLGLTAGVVAAAATVAIAAAARGIDVSLKVTGTGGHAPQSIPLGGFAALTLLGAVVGIVLTTGSARWAKRPFNRFVGLAVLGTAVSLLPDAISAADAPTMLTLWLTHLIAAAIIVPALACKLRSGAGR
jgi:hypothetical protein